MLLSDMLFFIIAPAISFALAIAYRALTAGASEHAIHFKLRGVSLFFPFIVFAAIVLLYLYQNNPLIFRLAQISFTLIFAIQLMMFPLAMLSQTTREKAADIMPTRTRNVVIAFGVLIGKMTYIMAAYALKFVLRFLRAGLATSSKRDSNGEKSPFGHHGHLSSSEQSKKDMGLPY